MLQVGDYPWNQHTKIGRIRVEHAQTDELLGDLGPRGNDETEKVLALEDSKETDLAILLSNNAFMFNGLNHDILFVLAADHLSN